MSAAVGKKKLTNLTPHTVKCLKFSVAQEWQEVLWIKLWMKNILTRYGNQFTYFYPLRVRDLNKGENQVQDEIVELRHIREKLFSRTSLLASCLMVIKEIGDEHFLALKFLKEHEARIEDFAREFNEERTLTNSSDSGSSR